jgi:hypothetical protein
MMSESLAERVPHTYPLAVRSSSLLTAIRLLVRSLPYALVRFGVLLAFSLACIAWLVITIGGSIWAADHIAGVFGLTWFLSCVAAAGWFWTAILRYALHLIECGHVAVLTDLITRGQVDNGSESMFAYGKRVVTERFGQVNALFALNLLVRGVVHAVHSTIEGLGHLVPVPGIDSLAKAITAILRAATRYMDKVIFSYTLATGGPNPWRSAQDGVVYYAQNAKPILKQAVWIVVLDYTLGALLWLVLLIPAAALVAVLPASVREVGGVVTIVVAILFALAARGAFVKPVFLIMIMTRFHALIEHEAINAEWVARLDQISDRFRALGDKAAAFTAPTGAAPASAGPSSVAPASPPHTA